VALTVPSRSLRSRCSRLFPPRARSSSRSTGLGSPSSLHVQLQLSGYGSLASFPGAQAALFARILPCGPGRAVASELSAALRLASLRTLWQLPSARVADFATDTSFSRAGRTATTRSHHRVPHPRGSGPRGRGALTDTLLAEYEPCVSTLEAAPGLQHGRGAGDDALRPRRSRWISERCAKFHHNIVKVSKQRFTKIVALGSSLCTSRPDLSSPSFARPPA